VATEAEGRAGTTQTPGIAKAKYHKPAVTVTRDKVRCLRFVAMLRGDSSRTRAFST